MHPGTKYLDTFLAAFETGSFVRAAERLHVTQSTVSYQIKQMENWLGAALFERTGRKVLPTALGEQLHLICGRFMGELGALKTAAHGGKGTSRPVLRIATGSSFGRYVLTPVLRGVEFEQAIIELRFGTDAEVSDSVTNGQADLGFAYTVAASNALRFDLVYTYPLVLIGATSMPQWVEQGEIRGDSIAGSAFITYDDYEETFSRWFDTQIGAMPRQLRTTGHCSEVEEAISMVAAGRGLSIVPGHALETALREGQVQRISMPDRSPATDTVFHVAREGSFADPIVTKLLELIRIAGRSLPLAGTSLSPQVAATAQG
jgi:DNA-binding transcriptional LysR family regulator